jgi:hypothetical protein
MNTSAIMDLINDLESRFAVDTWMAGGVRIWPYLRIKLNFDLYYAYHADRGTARPSVPARIARPLMHLSRFGYAALADAGNNSWPWGHADILMMSDGLSYAFHDERWYEKFCDPLISRFSSRGFSTFLMTPSHAYRIPRRTPSLFLQPCLDVARAVGMARSSSATPNEALQQDYPAYRAVLAERSLRLDVPSLSDVQRYASVLLCMADVYRRIIQRTTPSLVFLVSYYWMEGMALNLACRRSGIPAVDLQHGLQGDLHVAYARWNRIPADGYELLPSRFWVWEQSDADTIERWSAPAARWHRPLLGGNLWLNEWRSGEGASIKQYDRIMLESLSEHPDRPQILVTLQFNMTEERTLGPLLSVMQRTQGEWRWWVRLHPCMLNERIAVRAMLSRNGISHVDLDRATDLPLYALLRHMDLHITHSSSTVIEAEQFGVPSVVISTYGAEFFGAQLASGWAVTALSEDAIIAAIQSQLQARYRLRLELPAAQSSADAIDELLRSLTGGRAKQGDGTSL